MGVDHYLNVTDTESRALNAGATVLLVPIKPQPPDWAKVALPAVNGFAWRGEAVFAPWRLCWPTDREAVEPPFAPGDILHLREAWRTAMASNGLHANQLPLGSPVFYEIGCPDWDDRHSFIGKRRPPSAMPAWAIRHHCTVKAVSAIRVSETGEECAKSTKLVRVEYLPPDPDNFHPPGSYGFVPIDGAKDCIIERTPIEAMRVFWRSRYPKLLWESSWAWKVEVER